MKPHSSPVLSRTPRAWSRARAYRNRGAGAGGGKSGFRAEGASGPVEDAAAGLTQGQEHTRTRRYRRRQSDEAALTHAAPHHRHALAVAPHRALIVGEPAAVD